MRCVCVDLGARAYEVRIGQGLLAGAGAHIAPLLARPRVFVVSDAMVAGRHLGTVRRGLARADIDVQTLVLPAGESTKGWPHLIETVEWLLQGKAERGDVVVALGGGVIGDLVGFAAAIAHRGIRLVQCPTSLLAQVDSSVGGKTGINTAQGKNLVGAFKQPALVLADADVLQTLSPRALRAGYGEVMKHGLLDGDAFFDWLETNGPAVVGGDSAAQIEAVHRSVEIKARIVAHDETEQGGRALLNLGHTFCHALETATGYGARLLHGEGVAIGCALAHTLSARLGVCGPEVAERVHAHLARMGMKRALTDIPGDLPDAAALFELMRRDKKVASGQVRFVLSRGIGRVFLAADVPREAVLGVLEDSARGR